MRRVLDVTVDRQRKRRLNRHVGLDFGRLRFRRHRLDQGPRRRVRTGRRQHHGFGRLPRLRRRIFQTRTNDFRATQLRTRKTHLVGKVRHQHGVFRVEVARVIRHRRRGRHDRRSGRRRGDTRPRAGGGIGQHQRPSGRRGERLGNPAQHRRDVLAGISHHQRPGGRQTLQLVRRAKRGLTQRTAQGVTALAAEIAANQTADEGADHRQDHRAERRTSGRPGQRTRQAPHGRAVAFGFFVLRHRVVVGVLGFQTGLNDRKDGRPLDPRGHGSTDPAHRPPDRTGSADRAGRLGRVCGGRGDTGQLAAFTTPAALPALLVALAVVVQIASIQTTATTAHHNDFLRDVRVTHQRTAPDVEQALGDLEGTHGALKGDHRRHGRADAGHQLGRFVRQFAQALGDVGQPVRHGIGDRAKRVADRAHGVVRALGHFRPLLRRRLPALLQVLVQDPGGVGRILFQTRVQLLVLHERRQRALDLHVGEQIAGAQGLLQGRDHGLGLFRVGLLADLGRGFGHGGGLLRIGRGNVLLRQFKAGLQRGFTILQPGIHRRLIIDPGLFIGLDRVTRADLFHPVFEVVGRLIGAAGSLHLHLKHGAQLRH